MGKAIRTIVRITLDHHITPIEGKDFKKCCLLTLVRNDPSVGLGI